MERASLVIKGTLTGTDVCSSTAKKKCVEMPGKLVFEI